MSIEAKIENPISVRLGDVENVVLADEFNGENVPLVPGVLFGGNHYGFVLITDLNGKQKEMVYPTQCRIDGVGLEGGVLKVFEDGKKYNWRFSKSGVLEHSAFDEFTEEYKKLLSEEVVHYDEPILKNPLSIKIAKNPEESVILPDEKDKNEYPLNPGLMLGSVHFGFVLIIDTNDGQKEVYYPTQNRIVGVGIEDGLRGDLKVFENGKYHPWIFTYNGVFKQEALYNPYSRMDKEFIEEVSGKSINDSETNPAFKMKR